MAFEANVFVNCPFDEHYLPLLRPLLFTIIDLGLKPRIALEAMDAGQARLDKIIGLIRDSKFGIHDLSRSEAAKVGELYRLNMPFELGIDFGCRLFGRGRLKEKKTLVLEAEPYRYKAAISDLSGADIANHDNEPYRVIGVVRNWLKNVCLADAAGAAKISGAFSVFMAQNYDALTVKVFHQPTSKLCPSRSWLNAWSVGSSPPAESLPRKEQVIRFGSISRIRCEGSNDRDVRTADIRESKPVVRLAALADVHINPPSA